MSTPWGSPCCPSTAQGALPRWVEGQDLEGGHQKAPEKPGLACCMVLSISSHLGPPDVLSSFHTTVGAEISRMLVAQHIPQCLRRLKATSTGVSLPFCSSSRFSCGLVFYPPAADSGIHGPHPEGSVGLPSGF